MKYNGKTIQPGPRAPFDKLTRDDSREYDRSARSRILQRNRTVHDNDDNKIHTGTMFVTHRSWYLQALDPQVDVQQDLRRVHHVHLRWLPRKREQIQ